MSSFARSRSSAKMSSSRPSASAFRKCTPRGGVAPHRAELGAISQQFAFPETKEPSAHYTMPVDGTRTRIAHCSHPSPPSYSENRSLVTTDLQNRASFGPTFSIHSRRPLRGQSALLWEEVPQNKARESS